MPTEQSTQESGQSNAGGGRFGSGTAHVGFIVFSHPVPREFLQDHGTVLTFRSRERTTGDTWWRKSRTGPKEGDVRVTVETPDVDPSGIEITVAYPMSGFDTAGEWREAIRELHGNGELPDSGTIYRAEVLE